MAARDEIKEFLASRRAQVTPEQVGLVPGGGKRKVPGLRREEVAMLAGVSVDYYTRLERGALSSASDSVLDALADALRLDVDERAHLHDLARPVRPAPARTAAGDRSRRRLARPLVTPSVRQVLASMSVPAVVMNRRLDLLAENRTGRALYAGVYAMADRQPGQPPNLARYIFLDPSAPAFYADHQASKDGVVAMLRSGAGNDPLDASLTALIGELSTFSADFRRGWARHDVHRHTRGRKTLQHPVVGTLELSYDDFALPDQPDSSITTYTADPGSATADGLALLSAWAATEDDESGSADRL